MNKAIKQVVALLSVLFLFATACSTSADGDAEKDDTESETSESEGAAASGGSVYDSVKEAGKVKCGTRDKMPGFAQLEADGSRTGFDADYCVAIAAAMFGEGGADKVDFVDLETDARFTSLQTGQIDVLVRNTTFTATRDGQEQATFLTPSFYDGQGMAVPSNSSAQTLEDIADDAVICVAKGTTTEKNVADKSDELGKQWSVQSFPDADLVAEAFKAGQCDGWSSDKSQLVSIGSTLDDQPAIFADTFSREPLAAAVLDGNSKWAQVVNWTVNVTIYAEELGISQENVDEMLESEDPAIRQFLGITAEGDGDFDPGLGLPKDFAYQVIKQVGNYGEIYDRNLTPLGLEREGSLNDLAINGEGGLHYGIPLK